MEQEADKLKFCYGEILIDREKFYEKFNQTPCGKSFEVD